VNGVGIVVRKDVIVGLSHVSTRYTSNDAYSSSSIALYEVSNVYHSFSMIDCCLSNVMCLL